MNPIFDLMVIGVIVSMVLVNLISLRGTGNTTLYWTKLSEKMRAFNLFGDSPALSSSPRAVPVSQD